METRQDLASDRERRSNFDITEQVETYRGFMRVLRYVVMVHIAIGFPVGLYLAGIVGAALAVVLAVVLLVLGIFALAGGFRVAPREGGSEQREQRPPPAT
ncbi:MAG TPA: hypothetical protein VF274_08195 [Alphaproteobacteria bacterium]